ncbi:hypothetical protein KEJ19_04650 [Candidatus Bathyarchaeota archaeon]|nr:hypothetical protein [Candidatus Bathyarchaeota archaeon]
MLFEDLLSKGLEERKKRWNILGFSKIKYRKSGNISPLRGGFYHSLNG